MNEAALPWAELFRPPGEDRAHEFAWRVIHRRGEPFLALPTAPRVAARGLTLYAAQTAPAKAARALLHTALALGLPAPLRRAALRVAADDLFVRWLAGLAESDAPPRLAILAGNPKAPGRRFILLLFDAAGAPSAVVKAGRPPAARALIQAEADFLTEAGGLPGIPRLLSRFRGESVDAFALHYLAGSAPKPDATEPLAALLTAWLDDSRRVPLRELAAWRRVLSLEASPALAAAGAREVCAATTHGDFAPWNVKTFRGDWTALDWERGERAGVPGWDWLHYVIQHAVLVEKADAPTVRRRVEVLFASAPFQKYAAQAGIDGILDPLLRGYLVFATEVLRPAEGGATLEALRGLYAR